MKKDFFAYKRWEKTSLLQLSSLLLGFSAGKKKNKQLKPLFKNVFLVLKKNDGVLYWSRTSYEKVEKKLLELLEKKPKYLAEIQRPIIKKAKEIKRMSAKILKLSVNKKSDQDMTKMLQQLYNLKIELADFLAIFEICTLKLGKNLPADKIVRESNDSLSQAFDFFVKEISRRTFYSVDQLNCALPLEIKEIFKKKGLKRFELDERQKFSLVQCAKNGKLKILIDDEAKKYLKKNVK